MNSWGGASAQDNEDEVRIDIRRLRLGCDVAAAPKAMPSDSTSSLT